MKSFDICKLINKSILELLQSSEFLEAHRLKNRFVRSSCKLSMRHVITYLLYSSKQSMNQNITKLRYEIPELDFPKVSKQAVSKARQGILPSLFENLFTLSADSFYNSISTKSKWRDKYNVFAVDGSRIVLPNSRSSFEKYGEMFSTSNPKRRWTMALASTIYDVCNDIFFHGILKPYLGSERDAAIKHCNELEKLNLFDDSIVIFDRGYYSEMMFRYFAEKGHLCVMRIKDRNTLAKKCTGDCILTIPGDKKKKTEDINVRVIKIPLESGIDEYLVTSVFDESLTASDFKELYFMRWSIELKYNELKNQFLLEEFSGATSTSIEQEFFINLLLSNIASLLKKAADEKIEEKTRRTNKFRYQANRAFIISMVKWYLPRFITTQFTIDKLDDLLNDAIKKRSQKQPGRNDKRNKKHSDRERKHFNNRKQVI